MAEWQYAQRDPLDRLALLHLFSMIKRTPSGDEVEFTITIREYVTPPDPTMRFLATTDKSTYQHGIPHKPTGWGTTLLEALARCRDEIDRFPYEPDLEPPAK